MALTPSGLRAGGACEKLLLAIFSNTLGSHPVGIYLLVELRAELGLRGLDGGERGIRTPGRFNPSTVFKTAAFDHSASSPSRVFYRNRGGMWASDEIHIFGHFGAIDIAACKIGNFPPYTPSKQVIEC